MFGVCLGWIHTNVLFTWKSFVMFRNELILFVQNPTCRLEKRYANESVAKPRYAASATSAQGCYWHACYLRVAPPPHAFREFRVAIGVLL